MKKSALFLAFAVMAALSLTACDTENNDNSSGNISVSIVGEGAIGEKTWAGTGVTQVELSGAYDVVLIDDDSGNITLSGYQNVLDIMEGSTSGGVFSLDSTKSYDSGKNLILTVPIKNIDTISSSGTMNLTVPDVIEKDKMAFVLEGVGNIKATNLHLVNAVIDISGVGGGEVYVTNTLDVKIDGVGEVTYFGNPKNVTKDITITSTVKQGD
ncbi:MAG: DUF2807 domain-containing protein [Oscillospiraceae bacterium]|jgi:hypothetical protein|nr:DUF2807 domain-containing protein [Oscillospiraceae bacterium]